MTSPSNLDELHRIDAALAQVARLTDWEAGFTPINVASERERFLDALREGRRYEPSFEYEMPDRTSAAEAGRMMRALDFAAVPAAVREEYEAARADLAVELDFMEAFASGDDDRVGRLSKAAYWPGPFDPIVAGARDVLGSPDVPILFRREHSLPISPAAVADAVRDSLSAFGIAWEARVDFSSAARVRVSSETRQVFISGDARFTEADVAKIVVHEVATHVMRAENGRRLWQFGLFGIGTRDSEIVEEGMALLNETIVGVSRPNQLRVIALHVVGIELAASNGFYDTFSAVAPYFDGEWREAFGRVLRWKRGLRHQERPSAFWKDVVYFAGLERVKRYIRSGGTMEALYLGRYDERRMPSEIDALFAEFRKGPDILPILPPFLTVPPPAHIPGDTR